MRRACKLSRIREDTRLTKVKVIISKSIFPLGPREACPHSCAPRFLSRSSAPDLSFEFRDAHGHTVQWRLRCWPCAGCRSPRRRRMGCLPPFVYLRDECLLTRLNKGIISRLHRRGWTAWKEGNKSPGPAQLPITPQKPKPSGQG